MIWYTSCLSHLLQVNTSCKQWVLLTKMTIAPNNKNKITAPKIMAVFSFSNFCLNVSYLDSWHAPVRASQCPRQWLLQNSEQLLPNFPFSHGWQFGPSNPESHPLQFPVFLSHLPSEQLYGQRLSHFSPYRDLVQDKHSPLAASHVEHDLLHSMQERP